MTRETMVHLLTMVDTFIRNDMPLTAIEHLWMVIEDLKKEVK